MQLVRTFIVSFAMIMNGSCAAELHNRTERIGVGVIIEQPEAFDGKRVSIWAAVISDRRHAVLLVDPADRTAGIAIELTDDAGKDATTQKLLDYIYMGPMGSPVNARGAFTGVFHYVKGGTPSRILYLESTSDLEVPMK